ncbi:zinc ABC transporter solute-binding protein [Anaplasma phagocytophilum str. Norway variant1]|uniref:High-affinity zinc uptake system protein ZnuA n=1 Tax=Anaplasma phagocytophilum str. Norway variant1 TaxID=1392506 RepID=A0A7H9E0I2_ANAPH|nr:zinc ABC transporter substrate-binding protein [Anaplasma phagocytophilum]QLL66939.1 zinc ABC transporter solute-binding protein [Anaplasma phagocytophilum str. Norway variant1]
MLTRIHTISLLVALLLPTAGYTVPKVAATINPIHFLVSDVGRGVVKPSLPSIGMSCVHDYVLKPSDVASLNAADIVFYVDESMEPYIQKLADGPQKKLIRLSDEVELLSNRGYYGSYEGQNTKDFHIWLNPENAKKIIGKICSTLSEADPENAEIYKKNAENALEKISAMTEDIHKMLASVKSVPYIVAHDAYQYFDRYFGLHCVASLSSGHITAKELFLARAAAKKHGVKCIFTDMYSNKQRYKFISKKIKIQAVDPIGSSITVDEDGYYQLMQTLAEGFKKCLE